MEDQASSKTTTMGTETNHVVPHLDSLRDSAIAHVAALPASFKTPLPTSVRGPQLGELGVAPSRFSILLLLWPSLAL